MAKRIREEELYLDVVINGDKGKKELNKLERTVKDTRIEVELLRKKQKDLERQGKQNTTGYKQLTAAIEEKNQVIKDSQARMTELTKTMHVNELSQKQLRREISRLKAAQDSLNPNDPEWKQLDAQLKIVKARYKELGGSMKNVQKTSESMATSLQKTIGKVTGVAVAVGAATVGINRTVEEYTSLDDKLSDIEKTSGLTTSAVRELNDELEEIDTRTAQEDLADLAKIGGKLGQDTKEELEGFVNAANQIDVALREDLGGNVENTINVVGKMVETFNITDTFTIEEALLKVGSMINTVGAASTANEGHLVDFLSRTSGIANSYDILISKMTGIGSVADQLNLSMEITGTTFNQVIPRMLENSETFARIAGMKYKEFAELLETDVNEAFLRVLEGTAASKESNIQFTKVLSELGLNGSRVKNVIGALANNTTKIRKEQLLAAKAFEEGTSITEEYNIKNNNAAAQLEKKRKELKRVRVELGERLFPVVTSTTNLWTFLLRILKGLIDFTMKYGKAIIVLTSAVAAYNVALKISNISLAQSTVLMKARIVLDKVLRASTLLAAAAQAFFTGNVKRAAAAMRIFNTVVKANPVVLLISVLVAAGVALVAYGKRVSAVVQAQKSLIDIEAEAQKSIIDKKAELDKLVAIVKDETIAEEDRAKALERIKELNPDILSGLTEEAIKTGEAKVALDKYIESLLKKARVEAAQAKLKLLAEQEIDLKTKGEGIDPTFGQKLKTNLVSYLQLQLGFDIGAGKVVENEAKKAFDDAKKRIETERQALLDFIKDNDDIKTLLDDLNGGTGSTGKPTPEEIEKRYNEMLRAIQEGEMRVTEELRRQYLARKIKREEFEESMKMAELTTLYARRAAMEQAGKDTLQITGQINELLFNIANEKRLKEEQDKLEYEQWLKDFNDRINQEVTDAADYEINETARKNEEILKLEMEQKAALLKAEQDYQSAKLTALQAGAEGLSNIFDSSADISKALFLFQKSVAVAEIINNAAMAIAQVKASIAIANAKAIATSPLTAGQPWVGINSLIAGKQIATTKITAATQIAAIVGSTIGEFRKKKKEKSSAGAEEGGYFQEVIRSQDGKRFNARNRPSARGFLSQPTLLVAESGEEFVANNHAVNNPTVRPILDVINSAQRNGSISTLNLMKVLNNPLRIPGYQQGGYTQLRHDQPVAQGSTNLDLSGIEAMLEKNYAVSVALLKKLQEPFKGYVVHRDIRKADEEFGRSRGPVL